MPELPEVETIRRALAPMLAGQTILAASVRQRQLRTRLPANFASRLAGRAIRTLTRRGKYLIAALDSDSGDHLIMHLGMSGRFALRAQTRPPVKHDHILFSISAAAPPNPILLAYHDPRRFGFMALTRNPLAHPRLAALGVEPLSRHLTPALLRRHWHNSRQMIKTLLLAQNPIAGIGNIYASESLFAAGIHPALPGAVLASSAELPARLIAAIQTTLRRALAAGGTSLRDYASPSGLSGRFQFELKIYARAGQFCPACSAPVARQIIAGRASFYCPNCQPACFPPLGAI